MTLCTSRTRGTPSAAACARSRTAPDRLSRLDVDDDVRLGQRVLHGAFDVVGGGVTLPHRRVRGDSDHDVREVATRRLAHPQAP